MNSKNRRLLLVQAGGAGLLSIAGWLVFVDPVRKGNTGLEAQLIQMQRTAEHHALHQQDPRIIDAKIELIDTRSCATTTAFYHEDPRTSLYEIIAATATEIGITLDRIDPTLRSAAAGEEPVASIEHTIGFVTAVDRVLRFVDALERSPNPSVVTEFRARPAARSDGTVELAVEMVISHPVLREPIEPWGPMSQAKATTSDSGDSP